MSQITFRIEAVAGDTARVIADPVPGVIPDGLRVTVRADTPERARVDAVAEAHVALDVPQDFRAHVNHARAGYRFATTCADASAYADVALWSNCSTMPYRGAYRVGGIIAGDLPDKALDMFRVAMIEAAEHVYRERPDLWQVAAVKDAQRTLDRIDERIATMLDERQKAADVLRSLDSDAEIITNKTPDVIRCAVIAFDVMREMSSELTSRGLHRTPSEQGLLDDLARVVGQEVPVA